MLLLACVKPCPFIESPIHALDLWNPPAGLITGISCVSHGIPLLGNLKCQVINLCFECILSLLLEIFLLIVVKLLPDSVLLVRNLLLGSQIPFDDMGLSV